ncbi:GGDEF domain-containing protein [Aliarcobacter lanthieri]|uniref:GGDEF domain-containing protein n=1 Tax=Aliarcobacter lanthieri TaxID=1355374 RepID=UPI0004A71090|nr:GGDEF domain-containing protein [Aliarcobacter lanthieri]QKF59471.1 diguanylate cyclase [Aliarcobacter lanthieri]
MNFFNKEKSLKTTVLSLFGFIIFLLIFIFGIQLLYIDNELAKKSINTKLESLAYNVESSIKSAEQSNFNTIEMLSFINKKNKIEQDENFKAYVDILKLQKKYYAAYTGYSDGSFYEVISLDIDKNLRDTYNAKNTDKWLLIKIDGENIKQRELYLYDEYLNQTSKKIELNNNYDATKRPWYKLALENSGSPVKTSPYKFSNIDTFGITYSKKLADTENVVSIDFLMEDFKNLFRDNIDENSMDLFLFRNYDKQAISSITKDESLLEEFFKSYENILYFKEIKIIDLRDNSYIVQIIPIKNSSQDEYIILFADYKKTIQPYHMQTLKLVMTLGIIGILMIPIILYFSKIIVKPIYRLVRESVKIKNRNYKEVSKVNSSILEVSILSNAFLDMAKSIHEYQHSLEQKVEERTKELSFKNKELLTLSITDKLTGLYNRVKLDKVLQENIDRALRYNTIFSIILIDIDFFKKINDNFGHQVGDDVLKETAEILKNSIRNVDILGRWGGEEFLIICPETPLTGARELALKLNKAIKEYKFSTYPNSVTMSIGCSSYKQGVLTYDEIISNADKALYIAKAGGRDRVEIF